MRKPIYYYLIKQLFDVLFISLTKTKINYCKKKIFYRLNAKNIDKILNIDIIISFKLHNECSLIQILLLFFKENV